MSYFVLLGSNDIVLIKLNGIDGSLIFGNNYGTGLHEISYSLIVDDLDHVFLGGYTFENISFVNSFEVRYGNWFAGSNLGNRDLIIASVNSTNGSLIEGFSTFKSRLNIKIDRISSGNKCRRQYPFPPLFK